MTASSIYAHLMSTGVELSARDGRLLFRPESAVTPTLRRRMKTHKRDLLALVVHLDAPLHRTGFWGRCASALLARAEDKENRFDLRDYFEERAAIAEYEGDLSTDEAERLAFLQLCRRVTDEANVEASPPTPRSAAS